MIQTQIERMAAEVKNNLNLADDKDAQVRRYIKRAVNQIMIYCNRTDVPELLETTAEQIAEDMLKADGVVPTEKEVSGVTRGDTSVSYRDGSSALKETLAFVKNYDRQLIPFKKMKLPEDRP